eukprot:CAMPEP_0182474420 /NCGR_PEP_ID=MMETSP1319-20130603/25603_1 /TAXON_ID=172717 /ORGANISM="Bolidomonas pacifica, Strain RCC208" /LENGTH=250 /DNA_ID=CAMNT_0024675305 /DNA_START=394 /DNA_END=1142 /DNA_ORIENTATION=+
MFRQSVTQTPVLAQAVSQQMNLVNTNTRYLHPSFEALKSKLQSTLPPLPPGDTWKVVLTNSGSESNDLALRVASSRNGPKATLVTTEHGYHGHTELLIKASPYKLKKLGASGPDEGTRWLRAPLVRGRDGAEDFLRDVDVTMKGLRRPTVIYEIGMSVAGCVIPPEGYLSRLEERVREADGLLIFDCVQTGCGRFGKGKWWGFEGHGAVPDMVTVGKPLGGGVAVSALAVRASTLDAFEATGVEYFNTFG